METSPTEAGRARVDIGEPRSAPRVSVITPAYNAAAFIAETIRSLRAQDFEDWEHVVVDDGSTDGTADAVAAVRDERLRLLRQANMGQSAAQNAGLAVARGSFVVMLDADDRLLPGTLSRLLEALAAAPQAIVAYGGAWFIDEAGRPFGKRPRIRGHPPQDCLEAFLGRNLLPTGGAAMIRADALRDAGGFDPTLVMAQDWECWCRLALRGPFVKIGGDPVIEYRIRAGSVSRVKAVEPSSQAAATEAAFGHPEIRRRVPAARARRLRRRREANILYLVGIEAIRAHHRARARRSLAGCLLRQPAHARAGLLLVLCTIRWLPEIVRRRLSVDR